MPHHPELSWPAVSGRPCGLLLRATSDSAGGRDADCRDASEEAPPGPIASLDARRVSASAALARTTGVPLRGRLRRFGVLHALLDGHLPHDERPGVHLAIEVALPLLLALLLAFLWCRHGPCFLVSQSQRYALVVLLPAAQVDGLNRLVHRRAHGHSLRKSVRRKQAPPSLCGFSESRTNTHVDRGGSVSV